MGNVNDSYFDGYYKDIWRALMPEGLTQKEVEFIISYFKLDANSRVLDIMCGYGRHAIALARKGINVTALDNLPQYSEEIKQTALMEQLPLNVLLQNVTDLEIVEETFDLAMCMGNSLNFYNEEDTGIILQKLNKSLKKEGSLLINTWSLAEIAIKQYSSKGWMEVNGYKVLTDARYLFRPTRVEAITTIISPDGKIENKEAVDYVYSLAEMEKMLLQAGFVLKEAYSIPGRKQFELDDQRAYLIAVKK